MTRYVGETRAFRKKLELSQVVFSLIGMVITHTHTQVLPT